MFRNVYTNKMIVISFHVSTFFNQFDYIFFV